MNLGSLYGEAWWTNSAATPSRDALFGTSHRSMFFKACEYGTIYIVSDLTAQTEDNVAEEEPRRAIRSWGWEIRFIQPRWCPRVEMEVRFWLCETLCFVDFEVPVFVAWLVCQESYCTFNEGSKTESGGTPDYKAGAAKGYAWTGLSPQCFGI